MQALLARCGSTMTRLGSTVRRAGGTPRLKVCKGWATSALLAANRALRVNLALRVSLALAAVLVAGTTAVRAQELMTIDRLFEQVEQGSTALQVARSGLQAAGHAVSAARSSRLPDISASLSASYNGNIIMMDRDFSNAQGFSSPHWGNNFTLEAQQMIYTGGALSAGVRLAELGRSQADNELAATRQGQRFLAVAQLLQLLEADNAIRVYERNIDLTASLIGHIEAKHEQGMALRNDVTRYELQMETLRLGLRRMQDRRDVTNHQLCLTLGMDTEQRIAPDTTLLRLTADEPEQAWQNRALSTSTDLRRSALSTQLAEQQVRLARSDLRPKIFAFAGDNFWGPFTYDIPPVDNNFNIWYVGLGIQYSLSNLYKQNKHLRQARVQYQQSQEAYTAQLESVDSRVNEAYTLYLQSFEDLRTRQKSAQLARENYEVITSRYLDDLALMTDLTDASNVLLSAELDETNARIAIVYAYYRLLYVTGEI